MLTVRPRVRSLVLLALVAASACRSNAPAHDDDRDRDQLVDESGGDRPDNPTLRAAAMADWYDETAAPRGGDGWSRDYRAYLLDVARAERLRWPSLMPGAKTHTAVQGSQWVSLGPTEAHSGANGMGAVNVVDSGRINAIIPDGTRMYVATAGGGVWRRENNAWTALGDTIGTLSCGALAIDPLDHQHLILGLGDPFDGTGIGVIASRDGGDTWTDPIFLGDARRIPVLLFHPTDPSIVLAGTDQGLFRSLDGGTTWTSTAIPFGYATQPVVWSIAWTGGHGFALTSAATTDTRLTNQGQLWLSDDDGATWAQSTALGLPAALGRITLASAPSSPQTVYAMVAAPDPRVLPDPSADLIDIYSSADGGHVWTALGVPNKNYSNTQASAPGSLLNGQGWYNQVVVVDPTNPKTVYLGGALTLAKSTNGGATWRAMSDWLGDGLPYVHADFHAGAIDASNGGTTFTNTLNNGLVTHLLYSVGSSLGAPSAVIGGMQDNGTRVREGSTSVFNTVLGGDGFGALIHRTNGKRLLATLYFDQIYRSLDGGASWNDATAGIAEVGDQTAAPFITRLVAWEGATATGNEVYTFANTRLYRSTNWGASWTALPVLATDVELRNIAVAPSTMNVLGAVAKDGRVFLSQDAGAHWTKVAEGTGTDPLALPNSGASLSAIAFDPQDANTVYVASVKPNAALNHLWKSSDFGAHWAPIDGNGLPAGVPVNVIKPDPVPEPGLGQVLYAGTHVGLYRSTDGGATWSRFGQGLPLVSVTDVYIAPNDALMRVATFGRGFWELQIPPRDFAITAAPSITVVQSASATAAITTSVTAGTAQGVTLTASGLPAGATAAFAPASLTAGDPSTLTITAASTTPPGSYNLTITATGGTATHTATIALVVTPEADFALVASPVSLTVEQGASGTVALASTTTLGAAQAIALTAGGLPIGTTAAFVPASITSGDTATATLAVGATTAAGTYSVQITGTGVHSTQVATVALTVTARPDIALHVAPEALTLAPGASGTAAITTEAVAGFTGDVALTVTGAPAGVTAALDASTVAAGSGTSLAVGVGAGVAPGSYPLTITATAASNVHTATLTVTVTAADDFALTVAPATLELARGATGTLAITTTVASGNPTSIALTVTGAPAGVTATLTPATIAAGASATCTLVIADSAAPGDYTLTITGVGAAATHTATATLTIPGDEDTGCCAAGRGPVGGPLA
ncbi:MAG: hypothetical protein K8W52_05025, partial [Deltaproteobacteria bacterium]|nr:hypothetical protein [Deltaproteobacteria bacterium]